MRHIDAHNHVTGRSVYVEDIPTPAGTLHAAVFASPVAHGHVLRLYIDEAMAMPGVVRIFTHHDIPGQNQIGGIIPDEPLLASHEVDFVGMPIALVVATTDEIARAAAKKLRAEIEALPVVTDPRDAYSKGMLISAPRSFQSGNTDMAWAHCHHIIEGKAESGGQEHLYIETQGSLAVPEENGCMRIFSSTQGPTAVQRAVAKVLGLAQHKIAIEVRRLGGGFGGKEDQANAWAALAALAAHHLQKPVRIILHRHDDMYMTGKRHPYSSDFKIGLSKDLRILAYEATFYQNAGAAADLSPAILERTLFHATNSYYIPNVKATAYSCRTHLPPNTAFRGFGGPQGMFVIESAIAKAAHAIGVAPWEIQEKNLLAEGNEFPYGQATQCCEAQNCWNQAKERYHFDELKSQVEAFNRENTLVKKGIALMPICFGISFTKTMMNQGGALVHIYSDGSVSVSTGAVEMGQGVNTKMVQAAAMALGISPSRVKMETTDTTRVANTSPSAASATADLNGKAVQHACQQLVERLKAVASMHLSLPASDLYIANEQVHCQGKPTGLDWTALVMQAFLSRADLSAHGHYATPHIHFDMAREKGHPFAYHVYGTAIWVATLDCLRGRYEFERVHVVHDFGQSMNEAVDRGQIEGGLVQGLGWITMEEVIYSQQGKLLSNALSTYKIPDIYSVPKVLDIHFLETKGSPLALLRSKAVGEPPLMYGIGAYFALQQAIMQFKQGSSPIFDAPLTPEKALMWCY